MHVQDRTRAVHTSENSIQRLSGQMLGSSTQLGVWWYLLLAMPLGLLYFVLLVTGIALGLGLLVVWLGLPILLLTLWSAGRMVDLELTLAERWLGLEAPARLVPPADLGRVGQLRWLAGQPGFWPNLLFLLLKLPLGILSFALLIGMVSATITLLAMPLVYPLSQIFGFELIDANGVWSIDSWPRAFLSAGVGVLLGFVTLAAIQMLAALWRSLAQGLLQPFGEAEPPR